MVNISSVGAGVSRHVLSPYGLWAARKISSSLDQVIKNFAKQRSFHTSVPDCCLKIDTSDSSFPQVVEEHSKELAVRRNVELAVTKKVDELVVFKREKLKDESVLNQALEASYVKLQKAIEGENGQDAYQAGRKLIEVTEDLLNHILSEGDL